jgi:gluconokinase
MRAGVPLDDADRWPWLDAIRAAIEAWQAAGESRVVACSALKRSYRERLSPKGDVVFVYLKGSAKLIQARLDARKGHFFDPALLASQLATLEEPERAIVVDIARPPADIVDEILVKLRATNQRGDARRGNVE